MRKNGHARSPRNILSVDIGGSKVKLLATGETEPRKFASGPKLTPGKMVEQPGNLAHGWVGFDCAAAFHCPVRMTNDAAMQALGSYDGGRMLFLGFGTGLAGADRRPHHHSAGARRPAVRGRHLLRGPRARQPGGNRQEGLAQARARRFPPACAWAITSQPSGADSVSGASTRSKPCGKRGARNTSRSAVLPTGTGAYFRQGATMGTAAAKAVQSLHFDLPPLPYPEDALAPVISAETLSLHHGKHHKKYVDTVNELLKKEKLQASSLEDVVRQSKGKLFNNAAQAWNHDFYWQSLSPKRSRPSGTLLRRLESDFGSYEKFAETFAAKAVDQFGSGWAWLVEQDAKLQVVTTSNADTPMARGIRCLLALDVWEHAYYVDYRNQRERYLSAVIGERLNWQFAEKNLTS